MAPELLSPGDLAVGRNRLLNQPVLFHNSGADLWTALIDYSDGTVEQIPGVQAGVPFQFRHTYQTAGTYQVTVAVIAEDGDFANNSFLVEIPGRDLLLGDLARITRNNSRR